MAHSTVKASNSVYLISVFYEILARKRSFLISVYIWSHQIKLLKGHAFSACLLRSCIIRYQTSMNLSGRETFNNGNLCRSFKTLHFAAKVIGKIEQNQPYMSQNLPIRKINNTVFQIYVFKSTTNLSLCLLSRDLIYKGK